MTAVKYLDEHTLASCGDKDELIKVWDLRKTYSCYTGAPRPKSVKRHPKKDCGGFACMQLTQDASQLYVSCLDSKIYKYNMVSDPICKIS